jgi:hypothetical protein
MMIAFLALFQICLGATFKIDKFYSQDTTCSNYFTSWLVSEVVSCTPAATCTNLNGMTGRITTCASSVPTFPDGWVTFSSYQTLNCGGSVTILSAPLATCSGIWVGSAVSINCVGSNCRVFECSSSSTTCGGCPYKDTNVTNACVNGNPTDTFSMLSYRISPPAFTTARSTTTTGLTTISQSSTNGASTTRPGGACITNANLAFMVVVVVAIFVFLD